MERKRNRCGQNGRSISHFKGAKKCYAKAGTKKRSNGEMYAFPEP